MTTYEEEYIKHVGIVFDLLAQDKDFDPVYFSFVSPHPLPLDFVDATTPQYIQKVDASLQRVVKKMLLMEQELARTRKPLHPVVSDIVLAPPILTPPVDSLSPPGSASSFRLNDGNWEFVNHIPTHSSIQQERTSHPLHTLSQARAAHTQVSDQSSVTIHRPKPIASALAAHSIEATDNGPLCFVQPTDLNGQPSGHGQTMVSSPITTAAAVKDTTPISPLRTPILSNLMTTTTTTTAAAPTPKTTTATTGIAPCVDCIHQCALLAAAVVRGDLAVRIKCSNPACSQSDLVVSINQMLNKLSTFTNEVIQVTAQGVQGKLGFQASMKNEHGIWKQFVSNLNTMSIIHSEQVRDIASVCTAVAHGDLSRKITVAVQGETLVLKNTINTMVDQLRSFSSEVTRVAHEVGTEGRLGGQAHVKGVDGTWKELTDNVNHMAANLTAQVRDIASVSKAVAKGDLSKKISVEVKGEMGDLKHTINTMVDQLQEFATEVSRVSLEVGTEGKLGGQAHVKDVSGTWKELTDNVNLMASNLTGHIRDIATVCKAVACGDLTKKVSVPVQGEILELKETMNTMVDQLRTFAAEVTRVAREVGTEGRLGGQAEVTGVDGTWKELTDN
ncbi:hypothetical protein BX616_005725, partial [Lobosporangium transversale]